MTVETESFSHNIINIFFNVLAYVLRVEKRPPPERFYIQRRIFDVNKNIYERKYYC